MKTQTQTQTTQTDAQTYEFTTDATAHERADVYVAETYVNSWGDLRAVLKGDTYDAKEAIKTDWNATHYKPGEDSRGKFAWIVDATEDSFAALEASLADAGYSFDSSDRKTQAQTVDPDSAFGRLVLAASQDDPISVTYAKKNGNGSATKEGHVSAVYGEDSSGYHTDVEGDDDLDRLTQITVGIDTEDSHYRIHTDDSGKLSIFSSGYFPYMGAVESVTLGSDDPSDDSDADADADPADSLTEADVDVDEVEMDFFDVYGF